MDLWPILLPHIQNLSSSEKSLTPQEQDKKFKMDDIDTTVCSVTGQCPTPWANSPYLMIPSPAAKQPETISEQHFQTPESHIRIAHYTRMQ